MGMISGLLLKPSTVLYSSSQLYQIEKDWFLQGNDSFSLMQQASWQMASWLAQKFNDTSLSSPLNPVVPSALVWVGAGNNGGDGWLVAYYLKTIGWSVATVEVAEPSTLDAQKAKKTALQANVDVIDFNDVCVEPSKVKMISPTTVYIDALFGIGLDRKPTGVYEQAIELFNRMVTTNETKAISIDVPSGLVASTGQVFDGVAIQADHTLCLIAGKIGLYTKDGRDHAPKTHTFPLIPLPQKPVPVAIRLTQPPSLSLKTANLELIHRKANSHKGSFGHVLIIGGNCMANGQGMGGAGILSTQGAFAVGAGKVSVACAKAFHAALITNMPNAMSVDLHNIETVSNLIAQVDVVAIGMGLGRDEQAKSLFVTYLTHAMQQQKAILIDADGLYHLASCDDQFIDRLKVYADSHFIAYTPHSGEMARLLSLRQVNQSSANMSNIDVENDRLSTITQAQKIYGGHWLLKGAGSLVVEHNACHTYLCDAGNSGMATAGMGDVLSGMVAGLQAQNLPNSLTNAVMLHAIAGDKVAARIGQHALKAQDIATEISHLLS